MENKKPILLILIGITGDLASRKLLPVLGKIIASDVFSGKLHILGITRKSDVDVDLLLKNTTHNMEVKSALTLYKMDLENRDAYQDLSRMLEKVEKEFGEEYERLFYLSVPPQVSLPIIEHLGLSGLARVPHTKLLLEKPFGTDIESAQKMIEHIDKYFTPEQVYRIDHYLAKSMTQNMTLFRKNNKEIEDKWNNNFIERIEILASEEIDIEGRVSFYEQTGALRDVVQNHMLALTATVLMDITGSDDTNDLPERRAKALGHLSIPADKPLDSYVIRGQYNEYKKEVKNENSTVETYVSMTLTSSDLRWVGVPVIITAGKMLDKKLTQVTIYYKKEVGREPHELIIRIQPNEAIFLKEDDSQSDFNYADLYTKHGDGYQEVILAAALSNHALFTSREEVLESWRIVTPIQEAWEKGEGELFLYGKGAKPADVGRE